MNIRRLKKKKFVTLNKNEEEIAKDKLFQISYYCDEKYIDESQILAIDHLHEAEIYNQKRSQELQQLILNKRKEATPDHKRSRLKIVETRLEGRHIETRAKTIEKCIFNILDSNSVFVGVKSQNKEAGSAQDKEIIVIQSRKRMHTMPQHISQQQTSFKYKIKTEESQKMPRIMFTTQYHKMHLPSCSLNKRNYFRLKQKLRYDLFAKTLNCIPSKK